MAAELAGKKEVSLFAGAGTGKWASTKLQELTAAIQQYTKVQELREAYGSLLAIVPPKTRLEILSAAASHPLAELGMATSPPSDDQNGGQQVWLRNRCNCPAV